MGGWTVMLTLVTDPDGAGRAARKMPLKSTLMMLGWVTLGLAGDTSRWKLLRIAFTLVGSRSVVTCDGVSGTLAA